MLDTYERRSQDLQSQRTGKEVTAVSAKRESILSMPLSAYQTWADKLTVGFLVADQFLRLEGFQKPDFLPYRTQIVPLAAIMVYLGNRWLEPVIRTKISRWFWCGVFGELYGGAIETRIALDLVDLLHWIDQPGNFEPTTVIAAGFQPSRLDTLWTRTSAAYRGLYVLLQREGSKDFFWKARMVELDQNEYSIDIHHIFPRAWCRSNGIPGRTSNSIINKTPISFKANRMIGGKAPSIYLAQLRNDRQVQISMAEQNAILQSHCIDPDSLHNDDFSRFYHYRKQRLIGLIEQAMGKPILTSTNELPADDDVEDTVTDDLID
ncbi:MAG: hypothetical protein Fur005_16270 [Roseiflexaceae bacterium]